MSEELNNAQDEEVEIIKLEDENGKEHDFVHIGTIEYKDNWYCFFQPSPDEEELDPDEVAVFKIEGEEDEETLVNVEDEKLLEEVFAEFCRILEEEDGCGCGCGEHCHCEDGDCDCEDSKCDCDCDCEK